MSLVAPVHKHTKTIVKAAVAEAQNTIIGTGSTGQHSPPAQITNTPTSHVALYNADKYNDPNSVYYNSNT